MLQASLTQTMIDEGVARYRNNVSSAVERKEESTTKYGQKLLSTAILPFAEAITEWVREAGSKHAGIRGAAYVPLSKISADVAAFVSARTLLNCLASARGYPSACQQVGDSVQDEVRYAWLRKNHPGLFKKLSRQLERCISRDHKRTVIVHAMSKAGLTDKGVLGENAFDVWSPSMRLKVGMVLVRLFQDTTGLAEVVSIRTGKRVQDVLRSTEKTTEWIRGFNSYNEIMDPVWLPMVEPPQGWIDPRVGGYGSSDLPQLHLVKRATGMTAEAAIAGADMPDVYAAVNALQRTPWQVNRRVHGILRHYWNLGRTIGGLPASEDTAIPEKPEDIATNPVTRKAWRQKAARVHADNASLRSVRIQASKLLNLAQKFSNVERLYFPYQLDFRGRVYAVPTFLNPQGSDIARGLLSFADGVPMNDHQDAYWLGVVGANLFGKDKITFEARHEWVKENRENILAAAQDPIGNPWWQTAEEPWQFLAWCFEWAGWLNTGPGFMTHFPVCLDGTNNGLQILSMLTRDELAAAATNVLPGDKPADIYGDVAARVIELLKAEELIENKPYADYWLRFGVDRKTTKRPVMVLPYGGTFHSCREYVQSWYQDKAKAIGAEIFDTGLMFKRSHYLAKLIWEGIEFCVGRPRLAMAWLQSCADVFSKNQLPIVWVAPSGFPTIQAYKEWKETRVKTTLGESCKVLRLRAEHPEKYSASRQKNGISPNFVHSLDAAALVKTVALCGGYGIKSFMMIHDSYGTHSPKVHEMASALRTAFVTIFSEDWLTKMRDQLQKQLTDAGVTEVLPEVPPFGSLEVKKLYDSEFFFA